MGLIIVIIVIGTIGLKGKLLLPPGNSSVVSNSKHMNTLFY